MHWNEKVTEFQYPIEEILPYHSILVPNVDNTRTLFLMHVIAKQKKAVLLIGWFFFNLQRKKTIRNFNNINFLLKGEQGTAKTVMVKSYMSKFDAEYHLHKSFNFSSASTPNMVQVKYLKINFAKKK